jgi:uncharacterized protein involved in exopolysaccharide biosynthesis
MHFLFHPKGIVVREETCMSSTDYRNTISFEDILAILARRKRQIAWTFLGVFGAVVIITFLMPKQYESRLKLMVKNERSNTVVSADSNVVASSAPTEVGEGQINSEIELLNSHNLLRQVVIKSGLDRPHGSSKALTGEKQAMAIDEALENLQRHLTITSARMANVIQVDYVSRDPHMVAAVLQQLAASYLELHLRVHGNPGTYEFFAGQRDHYQKELQAIGLKLEEFNQQQKISVLTQQKEILLQKQAESEAAMLQTDAAIHQSTEEITDARKQLSKTTPRIMTQSRTIPNEQSVERLNTMLVELQNRRTELAAKFLPDDRLVKDIDQEISDTKAALDRALKMNAVEGATDVNPVSQTLEIDLAKDQLELAGNLGKRRILEQQTKFYNQRLLDLNSITAAEEDLLRSQKEAEDNYLLYSKKAEEARIGESLDSQKIANVAIVEQPVEPHLPSKPDIGLNLTLGLVLACFLSIGGAFAAEYFHNAVEGSLVLEELTGLPVVAVVYLPEAYVS